MLILFMFCSSVDLALTEAICLFLFRSCARVVGATLSADDVPKDADTLHEANLWYR